MPANADPDSDTDVDADTDIDETDSAGLTDAQHRRVADVLLADDHLKRHPRDR